MVGYRYCYGDRYRSFLSFAFAIDFLFVSQAVSVVLSGILLPIKLLIASAVNSIAHF